ncbi:MAG: 3-deoxy-D-manno-octulosonic acid transferase [Proteobacteria bacterium]|nr:3-deoxy-D-manno-octulosonic acid transferase [Pseudomonadota bacterium]
MLDLYRALMRGLAPRVAPSYLGKRVARGKEDARRVGERFGAATQKRPEGTLVWLHGASVGESVAALTVVEHLKKQLPHATYLLTSGTKTSADLLAKRMGKDMIHQYLPVDAPQWVEAFLNHWRPDLALWMESELWPNMLQETHRRGTPLILMNARMSEKSVQRWGLFPGTFKRLLNCFDLILTQTPEQEAAFLAAGARHVQVGGNIKFAAPPLSWDQETLLSLQAQIGPRPFWVAASTHEGEEDLACKAHLRLKEQFPDLLTIIIPRHPERARALGPRLSQSGEVCVRSKNAPITGATDFYLVDTMGELGLFFHMSPLVLLGGSITPIGGHNLIEPANLDCAVLVGPHMFKQEEIMYHFRQGNAFVEVASLDDLVMNLSDFLGNKERCLSLAARAKTVAAAQGAKINELWQRLTPFTEALTC